MPLYFFVRKPPRTLMLGLVLLLALSFLACGGKKAKVKPGKYDKWSNATLYDRGMKSFRKGHFGSAPEFFEVILKRPEDPLYSSKAMLRLADSRYRTKRSDDYFSAIFRYGEFLRTYPRNEKCAYAQYQIGMCYFKQVLSAERDPRAVHDARLNFRKVTKLYPESVHAISAARRIGQCAAILSEHEFIVGRFYYLKGNYEAALERFKRIDTEQERELDHMELLFYWGDSLWLTGSEAKGKEKFDELIRLYPKTKFTKEAKARMKGKKNKTNFWNRMLPPYL